MSFPSRVIALCALVCAGVLASCATALAVAPAWSPIAVSGPTNLPPQQSEVQRLAVDAQGGTFTLGFGAQTTAPIAYDASPAAVEAALNALSTIGGAGGSVAVSGQPGGATPEKPYLIAFGGSLANTDVAQLAPGSAGLSGSLQTANVVTTVPGGPGTATIAVYLQNVGGDSSFGSPIELSVTLPGGVTTAATPVASNGGTWTCPPGAGQQSFTCTYVNPQAVQPGGVADTLLVPVRTSETVPSVKTVKVEVEGGGAQPADFEMPLKVTSEQAEPGIQSFTAGAYDANGIQDTRAGAHPYSGSTAIFANTYRNRFGNVLPVGEFKDINVDLPPGFLGNPISVPECPEKRLGEESNGPEYCPPDTIIGRAAPILTSFGNGGLAVPVVNVEAPFGYPGKFYFNVFGVPIHAVGSLRSDGDYGLTVSSLNTVQIATIYGSFFTFWGTPSDPSHDFQRCFGSGCSPKASTSPRTAFLTSPTDCAREAVEPPIVRLRTILWQPPFTEYGKTVDIPPVTECDKLKFEADFTFEPSETKADSPAAFRTELKIPSEGLTNPDKRMTPTINEAVVDLPKGVVLNASAADGLGACSKEQIGLLGTGFPQPNRIRFSKAPQTCPDDSKIGSGEIKSELLTNPLKGALYLAAQGEGNPFGSLFALYLVIEDPRRGVFIKLPAEVQVSETDGQQRVVFRDLPQLPFTYLRLNLKGGNRSPLASPTTCGNYVTTATSTPWSAPESGPPTVSANGFDINQGPNGMPCANSPQQRPFDLGWSAGAESTKAGADGPFHFRITRPDGSQELSNLELTTPKGLSASLKGIPYCSGDQIAQAERRTGREEQASSSCPAASKVGTLTTGAGSGPSPFYVSGNLYLAGPYKGAPISVVAITPAVAGPFDLGNVVVRNAAFINRSTAQVTAKSDPIPQILKGVVLRIKDVRIKLDRDNWTINPTNCDASTVNLKASGNSGASTERSARFQVGGCKDLSFGPKLSAHLTGGTKRGAHPAFTATVDFPAGQANTKDVQVTLPHSEFLDQAHINTICTRVQAAANSCPQGAIYGFAEATTPLIDGKLTGPVFLKSSDHQLPDLAIALKGPDHQPVEVEFQGRIDSIKAQIRNTIEGLPDVPVTKFTLKMKGGRKGLLVNSRNLCKGKVTRMTVKMVGQNGKQSESRPPLTRKCKGKGKAKAKKAAKAKRGQLAGLGGGW